MAFDVVAAYQTVYREFVADLRDRFPRDTRGEYALPDRLAELTGISCLNEALLPLAVLRGGRILVVKPGFPLQSRDGLLFKNSAVDTICRDAVSAAAWLRESPERRVIVQEGPWCLTYVVALGVLLDVRMERASRLPPSAHQQVGPTLLHDVMSALHGYDRRIAGLVCTTWRVAACDVMLPVEKADVTAWLEPRIAELKRMLPEVALPTDGVLVAWTLTRHWLGGGT
jgi:hypothetical protein